MARSRSSSLLGRLKTIPRPTPKQAGTVAVLLLVIGLSGWRVVGLVEELREVRAKRVELEGKRADLEARHKDLEEEANFVSDPDHLEQELRTRYNYKKPGENVIVVVPPASSTTSTNP